MTTLADTGLIKGCYAGHEVIDYSAKAKRDSDYGLHAPEVHYHIYHQGANDTFSGSSFEMIPIIWTQKTQAITAARKSEFKMRDGSFRSISKDASDYMVRKCAHGTACEIIRGV